MCFPYRCKKELDFCLCGKYSLGFYFDFTFDHAAVTLKLYNASIQATDTSFIRRGV